MEEKVLGYKNKSCSETELSSSRLRIPKCPGRVKERMETGFNL